MNARKPKVVKDTSERWLINYADFITLLMVFFIILYSMSTADTRKFQDLTGALRAAFDNGSFQLVQIGANPGQPKKVAGFMPGTNSEKKTFKKMQTELIKLSKMLGLSANTVQVGQNREGIVVTLAGNLLFYPGGTDLKPRSYVLLGRVAQLVRTLPNHIRVEGNTDDQAESDTDSWQLSSLRADSIVEYLAEQGGIAPGRLAAEGLGQYRPVATNGTAAGRARNRRADIVILYPQ